MEPLNPDKTFFKNKCFVDDTLKLFDQLTQSVLHQSMVI